MNELIDLLNVQSNLKPIKDKSPKPGPCMNQSRDIHLRTFKQYSVEEFTGLRVGPGDYSHHLI